MRSPTLLHLFLHGFWTSVLVRAASGLAASGLTTLTILYFMQGMPPAKRLGGIMIGICMPQLATPLARALSPRLLDWGDWHMLYWFEFGLALLTLGAVWSLPLPPSEKEKVFEPLDFLTSAAARARAVAADRRALRRPHRMVDRTRLDGLRAGRGHRADRRGADHRAPARESADQHTLARHREMVRLMLVAASVRILLSEQAFGSVGLLNVVGMINDQMITLNLIIVAASLAGTVRPRSLTFETE